MLGNIMDRYTYGYVIDYAIRKLKLEREGRPVKFDGRCDSACTLYLALDSALLQQAREERTSAAATKPAKSGCGWLGLDWNSGWNWAPM